jgi:large subunit ribosomal protein L29
MVKANELRNMTVDEIRLKIEGLKKELFNLRTEAKAGRIEKPHRINDIRKDVARCETVIREKAAQIDEKVLRPAKSAA